MSEKFDDEKGIEAIMYLQGAVDIEETRAQATTGWNGMSDSEKMTTLNVYDMLKKPAIRKEK